MNPAPPPAPPPQALDPVRVTEASTAGSMNELVIIFKRHVFVEQNGQVTGHAIPSSAVAMTWEMAKQLYAIIGKTIDEWETKKAPTMN